MKYLYTRHNDLKNVNISSFLNYNGKLPIVLIPKDDDETTKFDVYEAIAFSSDMVICIQKDESSTSIKIKDIKLVPVEGRSDGYLYAVGRMYIRDSETKEITDFFTDDVAAKIKTALEDANPKMDAGEVLLEAIDGWGFKSDREKNDNYLYPDYIFEPLPGIRESNITLKALFD